MNSERCVPKMKDFKRIENNIISDENDDGFPCFLIFMTVVFDKFVINKIIW